MSGRISSRVAVPLLCAVQFVDVLGVTSATTAVPAMLRGVSAPPSAAALIITPYAMFFGGLLVLGALLGDRFGHRRILLWGIGLFVAVSLVAGFSTALIELMASRALLGAAAAISVPSALRLLLAAAPDGAPRTRALAGWSAAGAAAGAAGFIVGGVLTQIIGWPAVFWINVAIGIPLGIGVLTTIRPLPPVSPGRHLDVLGAVLLILAVMSLVIGTTALIPQATRAIGVAFLAGAILLAVALAVRLRLARDPLIPGTALRSSPLRAGTLVSFVNTATTSSSAVLATLELQNGLGLSPVAAGLSLVWLSLAVIGGAALARPLSARMRAALVGALGLGCIAAGNAVFALTAGSVWGVIVGAIVIGVGLGLASVAGTTIGTTVPDELVGVATGVLNTGAQLGTAIGVAILAVIAATTSTSIGWAVAAIVAAATGAWLLLRSTHDAHRT
jgi:MFS family permease